MATKITKAHALSGAAHTAGIFADLSVDGPVIGTLVAIVDRAKNLPNRKTIGKQDPYCAARLGKEAKKTTTDVRGGQTPKWDQELRFTVHDSADYYQLKISVFTDDKKTDLIGEAWVDLKSIVVAGGGQKDIWQTLSCRGKYAGEIRVEITFYDSRPKPDKAPVKARHTAAPEQQSNSPPKQRDPRKRRPLPSDPVTGEAPPPVNSPPATPQNHQTAPRHAKHPSYPSHVAAQSPLQAVEYGQQPSPSHKQPDHYAQAPPVQAATQYPPQDSFRQPEHYDSHSRHHESPRDFDPRGSHSSLPDSYGVSPRDSRQSLPMDDGPPPPPPAHRTRHNSAPQASHDPAPAKMPMRHDVLRSEAHRNSTSSYPGQPTYRGFESAPPMPNQTYQPPGHEAAMPRHHSHDGTQELHYRTMQPTVEDYPESPDAGPSQFRQSGSRQPQYEDTVHGSASTPAPLSINRPAAASSQPMSVSPMQAPGPHQHASHGRSSSVSPLGDEFSTSPAPVSHMTNQRPGHRHDSDEVYFGSSSNYTLPTLPASLVPGVDPTLSQEISHRIYDERREENRYSAPPAVHSRGRQHSEPPAPYGATPGQPAHHGYGPSGQDRRSTVGYGGHDYSPQPPRQQRHSVSPAPPMDSSHTIRRKSVSPVPPPVEERRSSEIPFGPDSYDAFNPSLASSREGTPMGDASEVGGKIITHDGKEVDPSDHLPVESWAPEPEPKPTNAVATRTRPMPGGAQPMPEGGRRQARASRAQSHVPAPSPSAAYKFSSAEPQTPPAPSSTGRNRLHKQQRSTASVTMTGRTSGVPSPAASSPLAPISPDNYQDRHHSPYATTPTRGLPRAHTWDHNNENQMVHHQHHQPPQHHGYHQGQLPPVPAKIPLMSGANIGPDDRSLLEEMQSIDIGAGRSRRRGGY